MKVKVLRHAIISGLIFGVVSPKGFSETLNLSFLQGGAKITQDEISALDGIYVPGKYLVDIFLNGQNKGKRLLNVSAEDKNNLCLPLSWLQQAGIPINVDFYSSSFNSQRQCYIINNNDSHVEFDFTVQSLSFSIPQKGLEKSKDSPKDWDYGVPALRFDYNINGNVNSDNSSIFASSGIKLNAEKWLLTTSASMTKDSIDVPMATATRAIKKLEANLVVGKTFINNSFSNSSGLLGFGINSDSSMSPSNLGYTPIFSGVARTHARVTLVQNNNVIYSEMVPPGPFDINNSTLLGSGDVLMTIIESDGKTTSQLFPITVMPSMLSPSQWEYSFATGIRDDSNEENKLTGLVGMGALGYGFSQATIKGSALYHTKYTSAGISLSRGLGAWGAASLEAELTRALYDNGSNHIGNRFSLTYTKNFNTKTSLYINSTKHVNNYVKFSSFKPWRDSQAEGEKQKYQYDVGISHYVSEQLSIGGSGWMRNYGNGNTVGINGRASMRFDHFSLGIGSSYSKGKEKNDYAFSLSVSIPLPTFGKGYNSYSSFNVSGDGKSSYSTGVSGAKNKWDYSVSMGGAPGSDMTYSANVGYQGDQAAMTGQVSQAGPLTTGSASLSGSVIALPTAADLIFTRNITDTIAIANVKNTAGVQFTSSPYPTNGKGNAVIPVSGYEKNNITLEGSSLPLDTELLTTNETIIPTRGAVVYVPFGAVKVKRYLLQIKRKDGDLIPNGTWATTDAGAPIGFITQNGILFISSIDKPEGIKLGNCIVSGSDIKETTELQEVHCEN
ncbi:MAG: fimbria/pilus outer membrane usher protein [Plesiomonas shigelloides]